jgi:hypothetical protein
VDILHVGAAPSLESMPRSLRYCPIHGDREEVYRLCPTCLTPLIDRREEFDANRPAPRKGLDPAK